MKKHSSSQEVEITIKVPSKVAKLYFYATPQQRHLAAHVFANTLKSPDQPAKSNFLKALKACQKESVSNGITVEKARALFGQDAQNLF